MTTLAHMAANLRSLKRFPGWTSLFERPMSTGNRGSYANISAIPARKLPRNAAPSKTDLDTQIATEELALAALIHSDLMSIRLPNVSYACLKGKTLPCRAIGGDFFDAIALTDALCAVVADVSGKGVPAAIVAAMLQGIIHAQMLADLPLTAIAGMVNEFLCSRATGKFATMVPQHQLGRVKLPAFRTIAPLEHAYVQPLNHLTNEKAQVLLAQLIPHAW